MNGEITLCIDLFCGLGGWSEAFLEEGYTCVGFDIEKHDYSNGGYPDQLVLQDVLTLHGSQFKDASIIVASPPCQEYSYMAMPWSRAKQIAGEYRSGVRDVKELTALFDACFRIQLEASEAAGHYIPMIVENVKGAQPWLGPAKWHYGSFYLWGDVPALMPMTFRPALKGGDRNKNRAEGHAWTHSFADQIKSEGNSPQLWKDRQGSHWDGSYGLKLPGNNAPRRWEDRRVQRLRDAEEHPFYSSSSGSSARKAASAQIAKIPFPLARWIAQVYKPK